MLDSAFWKERQDDFLRYVARFSPLRALWFADIRKWSFRWGPKPVGLVIPPEVTEILNAIARRAITRLPAYQAISNSEPWQIWFEFMRQRRWGFRVKSEIPCTELEWELGVKDGKPLAQIRQEHKYSTGDEGRKVYRRTRTGKLRRLSERELKGKSGEELRKYYHWLENGEIDNVFQASADLCESLASEAFGCEQELRHTERPHLEVQAIAREDRAGLVSPPRPGRKVGTAVDGLKLKNYRRTLTPKLTQAELADKCGVSEDVIQRGESGGRWSNDTFDAVAKTLTLLGGHQVTSEDLKNRKNRSN